MFIYEKDKTVGMEPKLPYEQEKYKVKNIPKIAGVMEILDGS